MAQSEIIYDFGRYLKKQRMSKDISVEEVSLKTKIRSVVLKQIENEDLTSLPDPTITKGFLRAYANAVGCDADEALQRYEARITALRQSSEIQHVPKEASKHFWLRLVPIFVLLVCLIWIALYLSNYFEPGPDAEPPAVQEQDHVKPAPPVEEEPVEKTIEPPPSQPTAETEIDAADTSGSPDDLQELQTEPAPTAPQAELTDVELDETVPLSTPDTEQEIVAPSEEPGATDESELPSEPAPLVEEKVLEVLAVELTWFKVTIDDDQSKEMTLKPGERLIFRAEESFKLLIGNAAGLKLELDGEQVNIQGQSGKVISVSLP